MSKQNISPLAHIHPDAKISSDVQIAPFCVIEEDVEIGSGARIYAHAHIMSGTRIGAHVQVFPHAVIGAIPQDLKFEGEYSKVEIGAATTIREFVTINRGTKESGTTKVGAHCLVMAYAHIAHDCVVGDYCILSNGSQLAGHVVMGDYAITGGMTGVLQFTRIGRYAFLSGGTLISKDVPPYTKVFHTPGNYAGLNLLGLKRNNLSKECIDRLSAIYHLIYHSSLNLSQAVEKIKQEIADCAEKTEILTFIATTKNGVIKKYLKE